MVGGCFLLLATASVGCNSGQLPTYPVQGIVQFEDGSRPMFGDIEFFNEANKINARGKINRDGTFTVTTYTENDGAVAGTHKIIIMQITGDYLTAKISDQIQHDHGDLIHSRYNDYRTSGLECTVSSRENNFELTIRKSKHQTPDQGETNHDHQH